MSDYIQVLAQDFVPPSNLPALRETLQIFRGPLEAGCTIAGGFVRVLCRGESVKDYLTQVNYKPCGDVDIFLPDPASMKKATSSFDAIAVRSQAGFGWNMNLAESDLVNKMNVQFIDYPDFCSPDPVEVIDRFDFTNITIGLSLVEGQPTVTVHRRWRELETEMLLDVRNSRSPFLGNRINKYLNSRGYLGVTPKSSSHITDWLVKCAIDEKFYEGEKEIRLPAVTKNGVIALFERGVASKQDVIMFLGRWEKPIRTGADRYSSFDSAVVDWAANHIQNTQYYEGAA